MGEQTFVNVLGLGPTEALLALAALGIVVVALVIKLSAH